MTYSIVARDPETRDLGVAVQSHWFAAGALVMWAAPGVGAIATQAWVEVSYGPKGLDLMRQGRSAPDALAELAAADEGENVRQVAMVDSSGLVAAHTGERCLRAAGHRTGDGYSCQANMMLNDTVWDAMADAYENGLAAGLDLTGRLLGALDAAEAEGGDIRGKQAAGIRVVRGRASERLWEDVLLNVRVDDHPEPLVELRRLVDLKLAYDRLDRAEQLELAGDVDAAFAEQRAAFEAFPRDPEIAFWTAVSMAGHGELEEAHRTIEVAHQAHAGWQELLRRMVDDGFLELDGDALTHLLPPE